MQKAQQTVYNDLTRITDITTYVCGLHLDFHVMCKKLQKNVQQTEVATDSLLYPKSIGGSLARHYVQIFLIVCILS